MIRVEDDLSALPEDGLQALAVERSPFLDGDWFRAFNSRVAVQLGRTRWIYGNDDSGNISLLPLIEEQRGGARILMGMSNYYSPYFDLIQANERSGDLTSEFVARCADWLANYDVIELSPLTESACDRFVSAFQQIGWVPHRYVCSVNWRELGVKSFDDYLSQRPQQLQSVIRRKSKKLDAVPHEWSFIGEDSADISEMLAAYHNVYYRSWKPNEPFPAFIDSLAEIKNRTHELRLGTLHIDGTPAASQLWLVRNKCAYIYKLAYDSAFQSYSPGSLLSARMFKSAIENDGVTEIDYLTGDDGYKRQWTSDSRPLFGLHLANPRRLRGGLTMLRNRISELRRNGDPGE